MKEIVCVRLENEMDLILAHKRAMKLCELLGFSLVSQTSIATAISEVARCAIEYGKKAELKLGVGQWQGKRMLMAVITDILDFSPRCSEAIHYAKRLVFDVETNSIPGQFTIVLKQQLIFPHTVTESKLKSFVDYFQSEPPISPYDELRRKNLLLQNFAEKIQASENDYRQLTDSLPLMMFSVNIRGIITYTNKWLQDYFGSPPKELSGNHWQNFLHPADFRSFEKDLRNAFSMQVPLNGQYRFLRQSSGDSLWHFFSMIPLKNEKRTVIRWIAFIVDIHAQKLMEQAMKDNRELKETRDSLFENQKELQDKILQLNRSNYELEQFARLASHDLQEPLRKIFFYSDLMKRNYAEKLDAPGLNTLNNMASAASRMKELINDLLAYAQLQEQKLPFEPVNLNAVIHQIIKDLDITIKEKNATIETEELPVVYGNKVRLTQLFMNLLANALKYSKKDVPPDIRIVASVNDEKVCIKVKDNGIGFDERYSEKIFGLFERLHSRDQFPGTGIGLSICRKITELHHGTISATSKPGEFSEFEVTLPLNNEAIPIPS